MPIDQEPTKLENNIGDKIESVRQSLIFYTNSINGPADSTCKKKGVKALASYGKIPFIQEL